MDIDRFSGQTVTLVYCMSTKVRRSLAERRKELVEMEKWSEMTTEMKKMRRDMTQERRRTRKELEGWRREMRM